MLRRLDASEVSPAAGVLARAFRDNPGMQVALPGFTPEKRLALLEPCMAGFVRSVLRYGVVEVVDDAGKIVAVSMSYAPGTFPAPLFSTLIQARGPMAAGIRTALRFARLDHEMHKLHPRYPHWYLWFLGVEPERQGQGLGSELLRSLSGKAEADRVPCYLETDKPSSVKLYERHGYRVESEVVLPKVDLRLWLMKRP
jgi:ribosomal protein S18 acetylase RimI-like enzyme